MTSLDQVVSQFLEEWQKRKSGELPMPDLKVSCSKCSKEIQGDERVEFTRDGLICSDCFKERQ